MKARRPYLLRALYDWIVDSGEVPNILVDAEVPGVIVPMEHVKDGQMVLNISPQAVRDLHLGDDFIMFNGRFGGRGFEVSLPIASIRAIYCRDTGQGLAFEDEDLLNGEQAREAIDQRSAQVKSGENSEDDPDGDPPTKGKPSLRLV
ncbi:MAG: ClpXP protease specificity-enhancing factor [Gammaproteobacteria bacterium TMED134]|nr:MAG: ClpXP protease specificity-enhancing factor [Gammaproteobacteria bacterium TMED134]RZO71440.1 MAG: ClpXP protease specificity-enhancing factor [OM182 bacterium]HBK17349.1 ClpXP protease specificity-enhancing factor [Gammaproteobacteria bacterium]